MLLEGGLWYTGQGFRRTFSSEASAKTKHAASTQPVDAATLAKARKLAVPVGLLAGVFGSFVGVGGGVLIVPMLTGACKALPQRSADCSACPSCIVAVHLLPYHDCAMFCIQQRHATLASRHSLCSYLMVSQTHPYLRFRETPTPDSETHSYLEFRDTPIPAVLHIELAPSLMFDASVKGTATGERTLAAQKLTLLLCRVSDWTAADCQACHSAGWFLALPWWLLSALPWHPATPTCRMEWWTQRQRCSSAAVRCLLPHWEPT